MTFNSKLWLSKENLASFVLKQAQNGVDYAKPLFTKQKLNYSSRSPGNGILNQQANQESPD